MKVWLLPTLLLSLTSLSVAAPTITIPNGTITISWDSTVSKVKFEVEINDNSSASFGWGKNMDNTDMVQWQAHGAMSSAIDMYSVGEVTPSVDAVNTYTTTVTQASGKVKFVSLRGLNGNGGAQDFVATLDTNIQACYAYH